MNASFADIHAAADFIGPGAVEVPLYQTRSSISGAAEPFSVAHQAGAGNRSSVALFRRDSAAESWHCGIRRSAQHRATVVAQRAWSAAFR